MRARVQGGGSSGVPVMVVAVHLLAVGCGGAPASETAETPVRFELPPDPQPPNSAPAPGAADSARPAVEPPAEPPPAAVAAPPPAPLQQEASPGIRVGAALSRRAGVSLARGAVGADAAAGELARVVQGMLQLQVGDQLVPADYLQVVLSGAGPQLTAVASSTGEFFFKDVPSGAYRLAVRTLDKEERTVFATTERIGAGELVRLGPYRIPIEAVKARR